MTTQPDMTETVNAAVARLAEINARIADMTTQAKGLKTFIRLALGAGSHITGDLRVTVSPRKVFDTSLAWQHIPPELIHLVIVTEEKIDPTRAKELLPEPIYLKCCRETEAAVRIA
jgi:hypothetical protein